MGHRLDKQTVRRLAIVAGLACTFLIVGSVNQPQPSQAVHQTAESDAGHNLLADDPLTSTLSIPRSLGTIQGRTLILEAYTGPDEPIYTLRSADGTLLATGLTADELLEAHPNKPELRLLLAGGEEGEALMLAPSEPRY